MKDFGEIFNLGANFFQARGASLGRIDFYEDVKNMNVEFS